MDNQITKQPSMMGNKLELPLSEDHALRKWANSIRGYYGHSVYLVGSQLTDKSSPRDVDVVCVIPDDEFTLRFGDVHRWVDEGVSGNWSSIRWAWADECSKRWKEACLETGLNIDFKIQPMMQHEGFAHIHEQYEPYKLDTRPIVKISELLELMLKHERLFSVGLCRWKQILYLTGIISYDQSLLLGQYIKENKPLVSYLYSFSSYSSFYWTPGRIKPRIKWLKKHIKKTKKSER